MNPTQLPTDGTLPLLVLTLIALIIGINIFFPIYG